MPRCKGLCGVRGVRPRRLARPRLLARPGRVPGVDARPLWLIALHRHARRCETLSLCSRTVYILCRTEWALYGLHRLFHQPLSRTRAPAWRRTPSARARAARHQHGRSSWAALGAVKVRRHPRARLPPLPQPAHPPSSPTRTRGTGHALTSSNLRSDHAHAPRTPICQIISTLFGNRSGRSRDLTTPRAPLPSPSRCPLTAPAAVRAGGRRSKRAAVVECSPDQVSEPRPAQPCRTALTARVLVCRWLIADGATGADGACQARATRPHRPESRRARRGSAPTSPPRLGGA